MQVSDASMDQEWFKLMLFTPSWKAQILAERMHHLALQPWPHESCKQLDFHRWSSGLLCRQGTFPPLFPLPSLILGGCCWWLVLYKYITSSSASSIVSCCRGPSRDLLLQTWLEFRKPVSPLWPLASPKLHHTGACWSLLFRPCSANTRASCVFDHFSLPWAGAGLVDKLTRQLFRDPATRGTLQGYQNVLHCNNKTTKICNDT